ncbi:hypothetical protein CI109_104089 [Kwoniella shandongensis]|uniref:Uncharacterized protein n=1 Tax=Kwoniella shandongensis TaxID=1734106 RepID=A0A5M6BX85_9TREE|nr:uncharacterized protein CI109_004026 [Kwoniella shandongensis]KAA5527488.1 hypothetical protein CI109_004026 [Kwoniella shandongensis]
MSLRSILNRSRDAIYSLAGVQGQEPTITMEGESVLGDVWSSGWGWGGLFGFGNHGYGHGHGHGHGYSVMDWKNIFFWLAVIMVMVLVAVITNPSESSFRAHLTELSFRRHLADIRRSEKDDETAGVPDDQAHLPSTAPSVSNHLAVATPDRRGSGSHPSGGAETPTHTVAPFRFANHVAISLRTPTLLYRSFIVCSITITSPLSPPIFLSDPVPKGKHAPLIRERHVVWFGFMGHWTLIGLVPQSVEWIWRTVTRAEREKGRKKGSALDKAGVLEMRAIQSKEESTPNGKSALSHALPSSKHLRKSDSATNLTDTLPLHSHPAILPAGPLSPESRRPSLVNLISAPTNTTAPDTPETAASPVLIALKAELATAQSVLTELQNQLTSHEQSVHDAHAHLQTNLDELRTRRKEDDAERQELKSRTKSLEEQKRQAEAARREAEKKLKSVEGVRDGLEAKIVAAETEVRELKGNMENSEKSVRVLQEEGAKHVVETREEVEVRKRELDGVDGEITALEARNDELVNQVKEAEERLKAVIEAGEAAKKMGPEEEMMMMAAAYEAAAQEGYLHGYQHAHGGNNQWASQAAAYMAEAGMPHLGYEYTARPTNASSTTGTGFGHLSKQNNNSGSTRDLGELRRTTDFSGFEDFGPGAAGSAANKRSSSPQPQSDSESDIYGHDPGSPNGGISSSFSANLLPQGLFRSLEGDQTPSVGGEEDLPSSFEEPLSLVLGDAADQGEQGDVDSGSESGEDDEDVWISPIADPRAISAQQPLQRHKRLSGTTTGRLLPPSTSSPSASSGNLNGTNASATTPPAIPGLPALPGSRRWFSGTLSSDNIPSTFGFMHPTTSNDSLNHLPGYENSPFAPTSSEKKVLAAAKWAPFSKRWAGANSSTSTGTGGEEDMSSGWPRSTSTTALKSIIGSSSRSRMEDGNDEDHEGVGLGSSSGSERKPFRFFSLRKTTGGSPSQNQGGGTP